MSGKEDAKVEDAKVSCEVRSELSTKGTAALVVEVNDQMTEVRLSLVVAVNDLLGTALSGPCPTELTSSERSDSGRSV